MCFVQDESTKNSAGHSGKDDGKTNSPGICIILLKKWIKLYPLISSFTFKKVKNYWEVNKDGLIEKRRHCVKYAHIGSISNHQKEVWWISHHSTDGLAVISRGRTYYAWWRWWCPLETCYWKSIFKCGQVKLDWIYSPRYIYWMIAINDNKKSWRKMTSLESNYSLGISTGL